LFPEEDVGSYQNKMSEMLRGREFQEEWRALAEAAEQAEAGGEAGEAQ
jgi:hypothetical protein